MIINFLLVASFFVLWQSDLNWVFYVFFFVLNCLLLHYQLNLVHIASHNLLSKNKILNSFLGNISAILGGLTLADFRSTHKLHHAKTGIPHQDPDFFISKSNFFILPFKIWYHDRFFWQRNLWQKENNWQGYLVDRSVQIAIILSFFLFNQIWLWVYFWLVPILVVGFFNGMFLFYFPHFTTQWEQKSRSNSKNFVPANFGLLIIDISRYYHKLHHDKITQNQNYFPLFCFIKDKLAGKWQQNLETGNVTKYVRN